MPNYDEATRTKMQQTFAAIDPVQASGAAVTKLYGQTDALPPPKPKDPGFWGNLGNQGANFLKSAPGVAGKIAKAVFVEPFTKTAEGIANALTSNQRLEAANRAADVNTQLVETY